MRVLFFVVLLINLAACATLSKEECLAGNWEEIGFRDGTNGRTSDYLQSHTKACTKSNVTPVQSLWEKGRQRGLPAYCVPQKAYTEGRKGRDLRPVCPAAQLTALQLANDKGMKFYEFTEEINRNEGRIDEIGRMLIKEDDANKRAALVQESRFLLSRINFLELRRARVGSL